MTSLNIPSLPNTPYVNLFNALSTTLSTIFDMWPPFCDATQFYGLQQSITPVAIVTPHGIPPLSLQSDR